ncbi:MAG TPA: FAD:protein FMN transferase [Gemmatimonadales bacterium]|nr:FAD:protein FMN transferase [Gemmatimonadales bacterium]
MQLTSRLAGSMVPLAAAVLLCNLHPSALQGQGQPHRYRQVHMGVEVAISIHAPVELADRAASAAFARIARLDSVMSDWRRNSELNRLSDSAGRGWQPVSAELYSVLDLAVTFARESDGAFDPTVGALTLLWRQERHTGTPPDSQAWSEARATVDWRSLQFDPAHGRVRLDHAGTRLDLGGIAKGWILDRARETLAELGATSALLVAGGDVVAGDPPPGQSGWRIGVQRLRGDPVVLLSNRAMAVSGPASQSVRRDDGSVLSHVIDPATGEGLRSGVEVTVSAPDGATADAVATSLTIMEPERWQRCLLRFSAELVSPQLP